MSTKNHLLHCMSLLTLGFFDDYTSTLSNILQSAFLMFNEGSGGGLEHSLCSNQTNAKIPYEYRATACS